MGMSKNKTPHPTSAPLGAEKMTDNNPSTPPAAQEETNCSSKTGRAPGKMHAVTIAATGKAARQPLPPARKQPSRHAEVVGGRSWDQFARSGQVMARSPAFVSWVKKNQGSCLTGGLAKNCRMLPW